MSGITQYLPFCDCLIVGSTTVSPFTHAVACVGIPFLFKAVRYSVVRLQHGQFLHSSVSGAPGTFSKQDLHKKIKLLNSHDTSKHSTLGRARKRQLWFPCVLRFSSLRSSALLCTEMILHWCVRCKPSQDGGNTERLKLRNAVLAASHRGVGKGFLLSEKRGQRPRARGIPSARLRAALPVRIRESS